MAVILSRVLTQRDLQKGRISNAPEVTGLTSKSKGSMQLSIEPAQDDVLMFVDLPSNVIVTKIEYYGDDLDTGNTVEVDFGIYAGADFITPAGAKILKNAPINSDAFSVDSLALQSVSRPDPTNLRFDNGDQAGLFTERLVLWELANLLNDPFVDLRIGALIKAGFGTFAFGFIVLMVEWHGKV